MCLYSVSSAALRAIGWEPARLYDTVPFTSARTGSSSLKFAALAMIPSKQHVVSVGLPGPGNTFSVYSADVKQLKPLIDEDIVINDNAHSENNNFSKASSPGRLRRSFHEKKMSPLTEGVQQQKSVSSDEDSSSTSEQLTIYFETPQVETELDYVAGFQAKHKRKLKFYLPSSSIIFRIFQ